MAVQMPASVMQSILLILTVLSLILWSLASIYRGRGERHVRYWLAGWYLLVLQFVLLLLTNRLDTTNLYRAVLHLDLSLFISLCFLMSFLRLPGERRGTATLLAKLAVPGLFGIYLVIVHPHALWEIRVCIIVGQILPAVEARRTLARHSRSVRTACQVICVVVGVSMLWVSRYKVGDLPALALTEIYAISALVLWSNSIGRKTRGILTASLGLLISAAFFPLSLLMAREHPGFLTSPELWALPKVVIGFGLILMLSEDELERAKRLSADYRILFDRHPLPMWVYDAETLKFLRVNDAAIDHYGYTRKDFAAMTVGQVSRPKSVSEEGEPLPKSSNDQEPSHDQRHVLKDGTLIDVDIHSDALHFEGRPACISVVIDITERKLAEVQLRQTYKLDSLGQLSGGIAHDFNNILAILMGNLELIQAMTSHDDECRIVVQKAIGSVQRGADLTKRLLAYARQQPLEPKVVSIGRLVESTVQLIKSSLGPTIAIRVILDEPLWNSEIDPQQLENALLNLALNARDAMPNGGELLIHCSNVRLGEPAGGLHGEVAPGDYVSVSVRDIGTGMSPDTLRHATEPFFTTKPIGQGTGLGLNMIYGFLRQSGGYMRIDSQLSVGTTVLLYLPRTRSALPTALRNDKLQGHLPRGREKILVVEDEPDIRSFVVFLLKSLGYVVFEASDAASALVTLNSTPAIDLLLTDVILPNGTSGAVLATHATEIQPGIRVLFSSGYSLNVLIRESRLKDGVSLIGKPFTLTELAISVRKVLDVSQVA